MNHFYFNESNTAVMVLIFESFTIKLSVDTRLNKRTAFVDPEKVEGHNRVNWGKNHVFHIIAKAAGKWFRTIQMVCVSGSRKIHQWWTTTPSWFSMKNVQEPFQKVFNFMSRYIKKYSYWFHQSHRVYSMTRVLPVWTTPHQVRLTCFSPIFSPVSRMVPENHNIFFYQSGSVR